MIAFSLLFAWKGLAQSPNADTLAHWEWLSYHGDTAESRLASNQLFNYWVSKEPRRAIQYQCAYRRHLKGVDTLAYVKRGLSIAWQYCNRLSAPDSAEMLIDEALALLALHPDSFFLGRAYLYKGFANQKRSYFHVAAEWYWKSIAIKEASRERRALGYAYNLLAQCYRNQGLYEESLRWHRVSLAIKQGQGKDKGIPFSYRKIGESYIYLGQKDSALYYLEQALALDRARNTKHMVCMSCNALAQAYLEFGEPEKAVPLFTEALNKGSQKAFGHSYCTSLIGMARAALQLGNSQEAITRGLTALSLARAIQAKPAMVEAHELLNEAYSGEGEYKEAWIHQQEQLRIGDSLRTVEAGRRIAELEHLYQQEQQERRIADLEAQGIADRESIINEQEEASKNLLIASVLLIILTIILLLVIALYRNNGRLREALIERKALLREVHHRVKNNLQIVSSLLYVQEEGLKEDSAKAVVRESRNRVESMTMIHEQLYADQEPTSVQAQPYVEELTTSILQSFHVEPDHIKTSFAIDALEIEVDTMVPIGLILNELLTNAVKHAFSDGEEGQLQIRLQQEDELLVLEVADNGSGHPSEPLRSTSTGLALVREIARKVKGKVSVKVNGGTTVRVEMSRFEVRSTDSDRKKVPPADAGRTD